MDGRKLHVSVSGHPVFDSAGSFAGYRGVSRDVTERVHAEQLQILEHTVARCIAGADTAEPGIAAVIRAVCESEGWECGDYWHWEENAGSLRMAAFWSIPDRAIEQFAEHSRSLTFAPGVGMIGKAWQSGQPTWYADTGSDTVHPRAKIAREAGIRGVFIVPVTAAGKVLGVMVFMSRQVRVPDERLMAAARAIGGQIGQFLQRTQAEGVLRESEERFRSLTALSSDWYWEQDDQYRFIASSGNATQDRPVTSQQAHGKARWEMGYDNMTGADWAAHRVTLDARLPFQDLELTRTDEAGNTIYVSTSGQPVFGDDGKFKGYRGVGKDITKRKRAENLLHRFRAALDVSADIIVLVDPAAMRYVDVNDVACKALGYSREELLAMGPKDIFYADHEDIAGVYDRLLAGDLRLTTVRGAYRCKDGSRLPVEASRRAVPSADGNVIVSIARDITERLASEETMRRFRAAMDLSADAIMLTDRASMRYIDVNDTACRMLGYSREELLEMGPQDLLPISRADLERGYDELLAGGGGTSSTESTNRRKDGSLVPVEVFRRAILSDAGYTVVATVRDISERMRRDEELRTSNERFQLAVRATNDVIWEYDALTDQSWWNENSLKTFGYNPGLMDAGGASWEERLHPEDRERVVSDMRETIHSGADVWQNEYRFRRADGSYVHLFDRASIIRDAQGKAVRMIGAKSDVTARKQAEETIRNQALQQRLIAEFGQQALGAADLDQVINNAVELVAVTLNVDYCEVLELEAGGQVMRLKAAPAPPAAPRYPP